MCSVAVVVSGFVRILGMITKGGRSQGPTAGKGVEVVAALAWVGAADSPRMVCIRDKAPCEFACSGYVM